MEFDYGSITSNGVHEGGVAEDGEKRERLDRVPSVPPRRARDLFEGDSCEWTRYYSDRAVLEKVARLYADDYRLFGWYDVGHWMKRLDACLLFKGGG